MNAACKAIKTPYEDPQHCVEVLLNKPLLLLLLLLL